MLTGGGFNFGVPSSASGPRTGVGPSGLPAPLSPAGPKRAVPGPARPRVAGLGLEPGWCEVAGGKLVPQGTWVKRCLAPPWGRGGVGGKQCGIGKASFLDCEPDLGPNANGFMLF